MSDTRKPKIGVITFVRSNNWGTLLQAYATVKLLEKYLGNHYDVELIDITIRNKSGIKKNNMFLPNKFISKVFLSHKLNKNYKNIIKFHENNIRLSERFHTNDFYKAKEFIKSNNYDVLISGSDEIWANKQGIEIPNIYYIPKDINAIKISIASSANRGNFSELTEFQKEYIMSSLSDYSLISVRDMNTYNNIKEFTNKNIYLTFDPTLGWEFNTVKHQKIRKNKTVIALMFGNVDSKIYNKIIERYGKEYKIVSIHRYIPKTKWLNIKNPLEFVSLYNEFDFFITSSYHGTVFSILNNKPFIAIDNEPIYKKYNSKIYDLLKRLNLENYYQQVFNIETDIDLLINKIDNLTNYKKIVDFKEARKLAYNTVNSTIEEICKILL